MRIHKEKLTTACKGVATLLTMGCLAFSAAALGQSEQEKEKPAETKKEVPAGSGDTPIYMSVGYIKKFCQAWNDDELLTTGLANSEWIDNDGDKGFKIIQLYRRDCPDSEPVEMQFERKDNKAMCVYAGKVENPDLDRSADYEMFADTSRWVEMGEGKYGPMKAMMFGRLKFKGPKMEAMGNMGPFKNFLLMFGAPGDTSKCP
jgi:putative sterol carrier protein